MFRICTLIATLFFAASSSTAMAQCYVEWETSCDEESTSNRCEDTQCDIIDEVWKCPSSTIAETIVRQNVPYTQTLEWYYGSEDETQVGVEICYDYYLCDTTTPCLPEDYYECQSTGNPGTPAFAGVADMAVSGDECYYE